MFGKITLYVYIVFCFVFSVVVNMIFKKTLKWFQKVNNTI